METCKSGKITSLKAHTPEVDSEETVMTFAQDSVEIEQNAKGQVQFIVKCYRFTADEALAAATVIFEILQAKFNQPS